MRIGDPRHPNVAHSTGVTKPEVPLSLTLAVRPLTTHLRVDDASFLTGATADDREVFGCRAMKLVNCPPACFGLSTLPPMWPLNRSDRREGIQRTLPFLGRIVG